MPESSRPVTAVLLLIVAVPALGLLLLLAGGGMAGCSSRTAVNACAKEIHELQASLQRIESELTGLQHAVMRCAGHDGLLQTCAKQMEAVQASLRAIESELARISEAIPAEMQERLGNLENVLEHREQWPEDCDEAEKLRLELDAIVQTLPPFSVERIFPRLVRLNWAVEALWDLRTYCSTDPTQFHEVEEAIEELLDRYPRGHFSELHDDLHARLSELQSHAHKVFLEELLDRAKRAIEGQEDPIPVFSSLEEYRGEPEVDATLQKLRQAVLDRSAGERVDILQKTLTESRRSFSDDRLQQAALLAVQGNLVGLIVELRLDEDAPNEVIHRAQGLLGDCDQELQRIADRQQEEQAQRLQDYQKWALKQIRNFDGPKGWYYDVTLPWVQAELKSFRDADKDEEWQPFQQFPSIKMLVEEKLRVNLSDMKGAMLTAAKRKEIYNEAWRSIGWKNNIDTEIAYRATRDAMVTFLLPIQPQLLDVPVAQIYQQAFAKGWQKLEGREDQLYVAQQSALVKKQPLEK